MKFNGKEDAGTRGRGEGATPIRRVAVSPCHRVLLLLTAVCLLPTAGCRQDMQNQPRMKPFRSTNFFRDGISSRPPVAGTVPRGFLRADTEFFTGKKSSPQSAKPSSPARSSASPTPVTGTYPDDVEVFPLRITADIVKRGKERYEIFCSVCHGFTGNGDGMIVRRGFRRAASFHTDGLRQAPVGHFFDAITNGWGAMPSYAAQVPVEDRWAIISYIRALQLSQQSVQQPGQTQAQPAQSPLRNSGTPSPGGHN